MKTGCALLVVLFSGMALAQAPMTDDERAALILYKAGKEKFKAGDYIGALQDFRKAHLLAPNQYVSYYLGLSYARLDRCDDALPFLEGVTGLEGDQEASRVEALVSCRLKAVETLVEAGECERANRMLAELKRVPDSLETRRSSLIGRCETNQAKRLMSQGHCKEAIAILNKLQDIASPELQRERDDLIRDCNHLIAGFAPQTPEQKAAFLLVQRGVAKLDAGDYKAAAESFEKALAVYDEPHVRLMAARAWYESYDCSRALPHVAIAEEKLPEAAVETATMRDWCNTFYLPQDAALDQATRLRVMAIYRQAARDEGRTADLLVQSLSLFDNPKIRLLAGQKLLGARRWAEAQEVLAPIASSSLEAQRLHRMAQFCAADHNEDPRKDALFQDYLLAEAALGRGETGEVRRLLRGQPANPYSARLLALATAAEGDCKEMDSHAALAREGHILSDEDEAVLRTCPEVAERKRLEAERAAMERARAKKAREAMARRIGGAVLLGAGAALAASGGYMFYLYAQDSDTVSSQLGRYRAATDPTMISDLRGEIADTQHLGRVHSGVGMGLLLGGAGAMACGVWMIITGKAPPVQATPGGISLGGGF